MSKDVKWKRIEPMECCGIVGGDKTIELFEMGTTQNKKTTGEQVLLHEIQLRELLIDDLIEENNKLKEQLSGLKLEVEGMEGVYEIPEE